MKTRTILIKTIILLGLLALIGGGYALAHLLPNPELSAVPGLPPLSRSGTSSQTISGITANIESYYADANRVVFAVRVDGIDEMYYLDQLSLTNAKNEEINTDYGLSSPGNDPAMFLIDFMPAYALEEERLDGQLSFSVYAPNNETSLARFHIDLDLPIQPALTYHPKETIRANGVDILLDRLIISPAQTYAYLCYIKPTGADWMIGNNSTLKIGYQQINLNSYTMLFDSAYGNSGKGGEPGWTPPIQNGRCVKVGFPIGSANPQSITLTIPSLEQSMPEGIPDEELRIAYEKLALQGIDMEWRTFSKSGNGGGGGGAYPEYRKLPQGMNEQEAYRRFIEALGYLHPGPWIFNVQLASQENSQPRFSTSNYGAMAPLPLPSGETAIVNMEGRIRSFDTSPDFKIIAFATSRGILLYSLETFEHLRTLNETENYFNVAWSPDGKNLAAGGLIMQSSDVGRPHLVVWDTSNWRIIFEPNHGEDLFDTLYGDVAWSPDGRFLATNNGYMGVIVYDVQTGKIISQQDIFSGAISDIAWSPDGSRLVATGDMAYAIRRWRVDTDESVRLFDQRASSSITVAWSPDGERIASGHHGGTACLWTVKTNQCDGLIYAHQTATLSLAWSPDGNRLATGGGVIRIWDSKTGFPLMAFGLNEKAVYTKLVWPFSDILISLETGYANDAPTIVRIWNPITGENGIEFQGGIGMLWQ